MKKILSILLLISVVLISGCTQEPTKPNTFTGKDCGQAVLAEPYEPFECMAKELATCSDARILIESEAGDQYLLESFQKNGLCQVRLTLENVETEIYNDLEGKSVTCTQRNLNDFTKGVDYEGEQAMYHIDDIRVGIIASAIAGVEDCNGDLKEALNI